MHHPDEEVHDQQAVGTASVCECTIDGTSSILYSEKEGLKEPREQSKKLSLFLISLVD